MSADLTLSKAEMAACDAAIKAGSKSFYAASLLLPPATRKAARALYCFCRTSDDLVDDGNEDGLATSRLATRLDAIYAGKPYPLLADRAFAKVVHDHAIPRIIPDALIEGFVWDEHARLYHTTDDLCDYAARVASTVGVMMTRIMGASDRHTLARAADLGLGMQLTNIARDVGEDAARGRIYLPLEWLDQHGIQPDAFLANPQPTPNIRAVIERLLAYADTFYLRALTGMSNLPLGCRPAIRSAAMIYREIGAVIRRNGYDTVTQRASTTTARKLKLIALAGLTPFPFLPTSSAPPHPSVAFLVDAAALREQPEIRSVDQRAGRMLELMAKAEQTRRAAR